MADDYLLDVGESVRRLNVCTNPSFETDLTGWNGTYSTRTRITTDAYLGSACMQAQSTSTRYGDVFFASPQVWTSYSPKPNQKYRVSAYVKNVAGLTRQMCIGNFSSGVGSYVSVPAGGGWTKLSHTFTTDDANNSTIIVIYLQVTNGSLSNVALVDAVLIEELAPGRTTLPIESFYFDGIHNETLPSGISNYRMKLVNLGANGSVCDYERYTQDAITIQSLDIFQGRRNDTDATSAASASFTAWYPNGFATPNAELVPGNAVRVRRIGKTAPLWHGRIRDARVNYGQPWTGTIGNGDILTIEAEGYLGEFGRTKSDGTLEYNVSTALNDGIGYLYADWLAATDYNPLIADSITGGSVSNAGQLIDLIAQTFNAAIEDGQPRLQVKAYNYYEDTTATFSDAANNATKRVFESIDYASIADNLLNEVTVQGPIALATAEGDYRGRDVTVDTLSDDNEQAQGLANDLVARYGSPAFIISQVSCRAEAQQTMNLDGLDSTDAWHELIGKRTTVTFRGTTTKVRIQGISITADFSSALYTYYFSTENPVEYLILDSTTYGVLDTNRLGW